ncbi:MAG: ArsA family ATPase [Acidimicrobiales bacterium]
MGHRPEGQSGRGAGRQTGLHPARDVLHRPAHRVRRLNDGPSGRARLVVATGKGGVGRSTVTAGIARAAAAEGLRVLAVDAINAGGLADALGHPSPRPGRIVTGDDGVALLELSTEASVDEYVRRTLWVPIAPSQLRPLSRTLDYVAVAAPAVREILTIGKVCHEVRRGPWDLVVVDGPATGHIVELLDAPRVLRRMVGYGPLDAEASWMADLLADHDHTGVVVVATLDELTVDETEELTARLEADTELRVERLIVNRVPRSLAEPALGEADRLADGSGPLAPLAAMVATRHRRATELDARLARLDPDRIRIGEVVEPADPVDAAEESLAEVLG